MYSNFRTNEMPERVYSQRRGVTLFIVLALMTMFAMLVTAFMVITTQARKQAEHTAKALIDGSNMMGDGGHTVLSSNFDTALEKLLIGEKIDNNTKSFIAPYSILENLYGHPVLPSGSDQLTGTFSIVQQDADGILYQNHFSYNLSDSISANYLRGDLTGCVLTMTSGDLTGYSTFIVAYNDPDELTPANAPVFKLVPFANAPSSITNQAAAISNCTFIINSPAFGGTGPGFNPDATAGTAALTKDDNDDGTGTPFALRPNILAPGGTLTYKEYLTDYLVLMNPDYTAPDYLNMFLAWNNVQNIGGDWVLGNPSDSTVIKIIPSFHRPQLVRYWESDISSWDKLRKIVLRPLRYDHPNFSGSNPAAATSTLSEFITFLKNGPWDVDNDGDGIADGIWIDAGLGTITINGTTYKKLVSYYVLDMDGRLNVNVHGNAKHTAGFDSELRGSGSGSAEVRLDLGLGKIKDDKFSQIINKTSSETGRYGTGGPGDGTTFQELFDEWSPKVSVNPSAYNSSDVSDSVGGNVPDLWGDCPITFDNLGNRNISTDAALFNNNPYLLNPYNDSTSSVEHLFNARELQYLLRSVGDIDYTALPKRLRNLLGEETNQYELSKYRLFLGTRSSDIPVFNRFVGIGTAADSTTTIYSGLYNYICKHIYANDTSKADALFALLPEEIRRGEKINLNRLTLHRYWTATADATEYAELLKAKAKFAQEMFYLLCVLCYDQIEPPNDYLDGLPDKAAVYTRFAQWSVNLVDFIDPDATMTPFVFNTTPFTTSTLYDLETDTTTKIDDIINNTLAAVPTTPYKLIWGMEKPEVALTKTFAVHNRRVADSILDEPTAGTCSKCGKSLARISPSCEDSAQHDSDFDQVLAPEGSLFVELYRQGNPNRVGYPGDLDISSSTNELNLAQKVDTDYVWRLAIGEKSKEEPNPATSPTTLKNDIFTELSTKSKTYSFQPIQIGANSYLSGDCEITVDRYIVFGTTGVTSLGNTCFYSKSTEPGSTFSGELQPNSYLVIAPRKKTSFVSKAMLETADGTDAQYSSTFGTSTDEAGTYIDVADINPSNCSIMIADNSSVGVNVSEPLSGATSGFNGTVYTDTKLPEIDGLGTIENYKAIFLQRLADPTRAYNAVTNPYITVDWNMIDLHVINSETDKEGADYNMTNDKTMKFEENLKFAIRQWGYSNWKSASIPTTPNLWDRSFDETALESINSKKAKFGDNSIEIDTDPDGDPDTDDATATPYLGRLAYKINESTIAGYAGAPDPAFVHFPWHDAPFANSYELMLVPASTPGRLGVEFHDNGSSHPLFNSETRSLGIDTTNNPRFSNPDSGIGPYLNFFHSSTTVTDSLNLLRLFDYVRVPSKFAGTIRGWTTDSNGNPKPIYEMREPGKINLNTATEPAWEALRGTDNSDRIWNEYYLDDSNTEVPDSLFVFRNGSNAISNSYPSEFIPFRSPQAVNLVPPLTATGFSSTDKDKLVQDPANTTLLRKDDTTTPTQFLLEPASTTDANPYTLLENYMRLSDMTTTRSNVFAVWMTIGYFAVQDAPTGYNANIYPDGKILGAEKGLDDGTVKRHRAFYLIDRSTPVGFRRGTVYPQANGEPHYKSIIIDSKILE